MEPDTWNGNCYADFRRPSQKKGHPEPMQGPCRFFSYTQGKGLTKMYNMDFAHYENE